MKYDKLKKRVVAEASIFVVVMIVLGAIIYVIGSICDDYEESNATLQKQVDSIDLETKSLKTKFNNIQKNIADYNEVRKKLEENRLAINRQMVLEKFNQYKTQYLLNSLHLTVSPAKPVKESVFKRKNSDVNFSAVSATFEITSDEGIYELVDSLRDELPGVTKVIKLDITQQKPFNQDAYHELSTKGFYPMVRAEIQFIWFGINYIPPSAPKTDKNDKTDNKANAPKN